MLLVWIGAASAAAYDNMYKTNNFNVACFDGGSFSERVANGAHLCQADNRAETYFVQGSITSSGKSNIGDIIWGPIDNSVMDPRYEDPPVYTGGSETDIIYQQGDLSALGSGVIGTTWCNDAVDSIACDQHYVRFASDTPSHKLACHETGHTVGLTHGSDASGGYNADGSINDGDDSLHCMQTPIEQVTDSIYGDHQIYEINNTY